MSSLSRSTLKVKDASHTIERKGESGPVNMSLFTCAKLSPSRLYSLL